MKKSDLDAYDEFFLELPSTDYLSDIEIQDDHEKATDDSKRGLSDEQVSQIAIDSLEEAGSKQKTNPKDSHYIKN